MCNCSRRHWSDPTISNRHLRIHCILYEKDCVSDIRPFVYATDVSTNGTFLRKNNAECLSSQGKGGVLMGRDNGSFLLDEQDELKIAESVTLIYHEMETATDHQLTITQKREKQIFASRYLVTGRLLGKGGYGKVLVGIHQKTQRQLACKVVNLRGLYNGSTPPNLLLHDADYTQESLTTGTRKRWPSKVARCFREFEVLKDISHPNIISIEKVFWNSNTIYIFEELVTGGDLFSYIEYKRGRLADVEAAVIVRQILIGIEYLHSHGIVHRDLKPDNVLMTSLEDGARIVITDFGNARCLPHAHTTPRARSTSKGRMFSLVGTLEYAAPEIHKRNPTIPAEQGYSKAVDMWSIGSITATLLTGDVIFTDRGHPDYDEDPFEVIMGLAARCDISVIDDETDNAWSKVGDRPKDFIKKSLVLHEEDRLTATKALAHQWFSNSRHAPEFEALYERSIKDWQPREKAVDLVERIPEILPAAGESHNTMSYHFPPASREWPISNNRVRATPQQSAQKPPFAPVTEEYEEHYFEGPSNHERQFFEQQSYEHGSNGYGCLQAPSQFHRPDSLDDSMKYLSVDADPPASGMYSAHEAQPRYLYDRNLGEVEVEDSQQGDNSQSRTPETQIDSLVISDTPVKVGTKRPPSSQEMLPPYKSFFSEEYTTTGHTVPKRRKLTSTYY